MLRDSGSQVLFTTETLKSIIRLCESERERDREKLCMCVCVCVRERDRE